MSKHSLQQTSAQETTVAPPTYLNEAGMTSGNRCICSFAPPHGLTPTIRDHASSNHSNVGYFISTNVNSEGGNCATSVPSQSKVLTRTRHRVISESSFVPPRGFTLTGEDHASNHFFDVEAFASTNTDSEDGNRATSVPSQGKVLSRRRHRVISVHFRPYLRVPSN